MSLTAKLSNPTPWDVKLPYEKGINIHIPAFGSTGLTMQMLDDYRGGKPGSEAINVILDYDGLFVVDSDRPYDNQALDALRRCHKAKKSQLDAAVSNISRQRAAAGTPPDADALEETLRMSGHAALRDKVELLEKQIKEYTKVVDPESDRNARTQLDPTRTVFVMDPPTEFDSVAAMNFFLGLDENRELKNKHAAYVEQVANAVKE